jgi:hypothetical protein
MDTLDRIPISVAVVLCTAIWLLAIGLYGCSE